MAEDREDPRVAARTAITTHDGDWQPGSRHELGETLAWRPDLQHTDGRLLLISFGDLQPWADRLRAACSDGRRVVLALGQSAITLDNLVLAQEVRAELLIVSDSGDGTLRIVEHSSVADLVAMEDLALGEGGLTRLALPHLDRALEAEGSYDKGLLFEEVLCLLFSQVSYVAVLEHRYKNETEEIDLVLGNKATGYLTGIFAGPLILVSGKNQRKASGAPDVRDLRGNMGKRRKRCNFGVLCSADRIAEEAESEQAEATDDPEKAVALLNGKTIRRLLESSNLDEDLEVELRKAVLRPRRGFETD